MADIPIIFSAPMVRALLEGRKTMTRRMAKRKVPFFKGSPHFRMMDTPWQNVKPGDRLWVRENLTRGGGYIQYPADTRTLRDVLGSRFAHETLWPSAWKQDPRPSIHMPRWASRLTLIVTATKIERLQSITDADCLAEGVDRLDPERHVRCYSGSQSVMKNGHLGLISHYGAEFRDIWCSLHGRAAWDANPEVVAITFTVHKQNIDALPKAEAA